MGVFWSIIIIVCITIGLAAFFMWAVHPARGSKERMKPFMNTKFAHRGLWNIARTVPENTMEAFRLAVKNNFAIELDVHMTKDKKLAVFHDDTLRRMCGRPEKIEDLTWDELSDLSLQHTSHRMPLLSDVLAEVGGKVPLLIELKQPTVKTDMCPLVYRMLQSYRGRFLIESFNPFGLRWFKKNAPEILRGQLACRHEEVKNVPLLAKMASGALLVNLLSRPHFIAYDHHTANGLGFRLNRSLYHTPAFAWTVRSQKEMEACSSEFDGIIFEKFLPV